MRTASAARIDPLRPQHARLHDGATIAAIAVRSLILELETWPKPGLVSHIDSGSHDDMDAAMFRASARAIQPYLAAMADAGAEGCSMGRLRIIGLDAEAAMMDATSGINTHRGAIFGLGLLCAAFGARAAGLAGTDTSMGAVVASRWGQDIINGPVSLHSHGAGVFRRYGAGGARMEAALGFPSLYEIGLPALRKAALAAPNDQEAQRVETCFSLIAVVEDTNLLHRGGPSGLRYARHTARQFIRHGGVARPSWRARARTAHESFIARRLSPGGSADILAMSLFVSACEKGAL